MNHTENFNLGLPLVSEKYDVTVFNTNYTIIDETLTHVNRNNNPHGVTAAQVGLGNVDNTSDAAKPVSTLQAQAIAQAVSAEETRAKAAEQANADAIASIQSSMPGLATTLVAGLVKPDGTTITVTNDGTISATQATVDSALSTTSTNAAQNKVITAALNGKADKSTTYTKTEVDNLLSAFETNIDWKEAVATYADIATTYPNPQDGWTVNVNDTDYTYRYNGTSWISISANSIPNATTSVNGLMTSAMVTKLNGIEDGAQVNTITGVKGDAESSYRTGNVNITKANVGLGNVPNVTTNDQTPTFTQASTRTNIESGETLSTIFGKVSKYFADLKTVAFSGSYNDLSNKPTIGNATLTIQKNGVAVNTFTANATSNVTANIVVPTKVSELTNDSGYTTNTGTVTSIATGAGLTGGTITGSGTLKAKLKSETLSTLTAADRGSTANREYPVGLDADGNLSVNVPWQNNTYTVNNGTLTIQKNGTNVQTFTANQSSSVTANITVPTKVSELTNDSGYSTTTGTVTSVATGVGLTGGTITGTGTIKAKLRSETALTNDSAAATETAGRIYPVVPDKSGYLAVNVPWQNTNTTYSAGVGMTLSSTTFKAKLRSETALTNDSAAATETSGRIYPVVPDKSGYLAVNVPWTDNNSTYPKAVKNITRSGTTFTATCYDDTTFTFTQQDNNTWTAMVGATSSANGSVGYVNAVPPKDGYNTKYLRADGTWAVPPGTNTTTGTVTSVATGVGLTGGTITSTGTIKAKLRSETALTNDSAAATETAGRIYPVVPDKSGYLAVNVPWSNSTYTAATAAPGKVASSSAQGSSTNYARQDHTHGIDLATGDSNGQVKIAGTNVSVKGLGSNAYSSTAFLPLAGGTMTGRITSAKPNKMLVTGSGTAATTSGSNYVPAKWTFNTGIAAADGDMITIKLPCAGHSYGVFMSIDNGSNYYPVVLNGTSRLTTHYGNGTYITVQFESGGSAADMFPLAGGTSRQTITGGVWRVINFFDSNSNTIPSAYCSTAAATAAKAADCSGYSLLANSYIHVIVTQTNTSASAITLNINGKGAKPIYINGSASSSSNYSLTAGSYLVYYNGTNYYFRTDGKLTGAGMVDIGGNTGKFLRGDGTWQTPTNTWTALVGATSSANGSVGYINATPPKDGYNTKFFRADGTWAVPSGTATVNNGTLTIQKNGTNVQTFTANQSSNATANITVPTKVSELTNDSGFTTLAIGTTASTAAAGNHTHDISIAADSGTNQITLAASTKYKITAGGQSYIFTTPPNSTYTVNNGTLTIQKNGTNVQTFTANQSSNATANITVPTKVSELTNDSGFITSYSNNRRGFWGTSSTAAATAEKAVTLGSAAGWELVAGTIVGVKFTNTNTAGTVKLNVNSSGAKQIWYNGAAYTGTEARITGWAGHTIFYMYDGTYWEFLNNDANYINTNTWTALVGATSSANGSVGYINSAPPKDGYNTKFFRADGTWAVPSGTATVNNGTLTIQKNGTNVQTFTANQSSNATANITVPTKTSDLTNDSGFITSGVTSVKVGTTSYTPSSGVVSLPAYPTVNNATLTIQKNGTAVKTFTANASSDVTCNITVPTKTSELTNDSGYTTNTGTVTSVKVGSTSYSPSSGVVSLPEYPTVNNAKLTIQRNGTSVKTFTANASSNVTANIIVDSWTSTATVSSSGTVEFSSLDDSLGYELYCQDKLLTVTAISKSGSGTSTTLTYTVSGAATGDVCKLRVLR